MTNTAEEPSAGRPRTEGHVVVGYDGSEPADHAVDRAAVEAELRGTGLDVLYGWPWTVSSFAERGHRMVGDSVGELRDEARAALDQAAERVRARHPGVLVTATMTQDAAAHTLIRAGRNAALTVVGTRGHGGFAGLLLGSVSLRVAAHCAGPLLVVRGEAEAGAGGGAGGERGVVLLAVKSDTDVAAARFAFEEARRRAARLNALHAWLYPQLPEGMRLRPGDSDARVVEEYRKAAEGVARYAVSPFREEFPEVKAGADHLLAQPAAALVEASREADLVVLATHRPRHRIALQLGPVTHALLHHAHCPVALIPDGTD